MPDGKTILSRASDGVGRLISTSLASVWGRVVVLRHQKSGLLQSYDLESPCPCADMFPPDISPDCYLLGWCSDTGVKGGGTEFATAAGFSIGGGMILAVGMFDGGIMVYNVLDEWRGLPWNLTPTSSQRKFKR
ncbi:hypothetical protein N7517_010463 [Penicillium concentricum]|uniref:Uncharacterized protein n=1 Tax=Penicillium concentricum TaxID=293559 RepID=A0A9W9UTC7_9EURO|nr:uncharacterized protein N7517_010463 [Penicillium concentricum]KAJ5355854.1 hypothetical protein N7517_010463 [Penicillium concentricum]